MTLLAAWKALLHRLSGQDDLLVGMPIAGRNRAETEGTLGFFVNTLVLRSRLDGNPTFGALLAQVRETALGAYANQDLPFEKLVAELQPERDLDRTPLFQVFFNHFQESRDRIALPGLTLEPVASAPAASKFDLTVYFSESSEGFHFAVLYDAGLFDRARIEEMLRQLEQLLAAALDHPELAVGIDDISLITPHAAAVLPDPAQALAGQAGAEHAGAPLHELFARQARSFPGRLAVADGEESWTYGELAAAADRLARHLAGAGLAPGDVVAIAAERRAALAWAVLGTLGAGCAFLLLDPDYPAARRAAMLRLGGTRAFVRLPGTADIEPELAAVLAGLPPHRIVDGAAVAGPAASAVSLEPLRSVGPGDPAYVAFTSGSTGEPKAILGTHGPLTHFLAWDAATFGLGEGDRFSLLSGLGHDPLLRDLLVPLALSATLCVPPPASLERPERLLAWLAAERVSVLHLTPAFGQLLAQGAAPQAASPVLPDLRFAFFGGDLLTAADVARLRRLAPAARVVSFYGATETPQAMAWYEVPGNEAAEPGPATVPLGTGIDGVQLLVRGGWGERGVWAGIGELGEVVVRTPFLARGYLGDEALTRERFLPDPAGGGARLYRTGDLGRYRPDGRVEPAGRADRQIKIRGFRVEPAEIEAALAADPAVAEAAVVFGGGRLAAFIVPRPEALLDDGANIADIADIAVLRRLAERLPSYMVPAAILRLERLPLTPNRKIDRRALLRLLAEGEADRERAAGRVAPRDPVEEVVAGIWEEVLGPGRTGGQVGVHDSFFALGGHSLLATQVLSRLRQAFAVEMPLRQLFEAPTVAGLARAVTALLAAGSAITQPPLVPVPRGEGVELPLSFAQQRLWVLDQLEPGSFAYNFATAAQLQGGLSVAALGRALAGVVRRHEALRTVFPARDGEPRQVILPAPGTRPLPLADLAALPAAQQMAEAARLAAADSLRPFDLAGGPLLRTTLLRLGEREHTLLLAMHHIVTDGWSIGVFTRELTALYHADLQGEQAAGLPELPVQYADFAVWQRRWLQGEVLAEQLRYWSGTLAGAPPVLELPTDRPRPAVQSHRGGQRWLTLPRELAAKLGAEARRLDVTPFMALLAAFAVLLRRYTGSEDLVLGTPIANRGRRELEDLIGFFANTLALRVDAGGNPAFTELARRVRQVALGAYAHQDLPFERLVDELQPERSLGHTPVFQVMFTVQNAPAPELELGQEPREAAFRPADVDEGKAQFDLTLALMQIDGELLAKLEYSSDLFDAATAERLLGHFGNLVAAAEARPEARISTLPLLSAAERRELLITWNDSRADFPAELTVHALIAASVARRPDAVAVSCGGRQLLYGELDECAGRLARRLVRLGVGPEVRVGLCLERTPEMVVAMLAVLAAGGAYLPLDPTHPAERLSWILEDAGVRVLIADPGSLAALPANGATVVDPNVEETPEVREADEAGEPLAERATPESLAYVIYTSGSTGRPKGVEVRHRGVVNYIASMARRPGLTERDAVLALTTLSFDIAVTELLLPLAVGARIELVDRETAADAERLAAVIESAGVTVMQATPATWTLLLEGGWPGRPGLTALAGGEALPLALAERLAGRVDALWNVYGPTETTVWSTLHPVVTGQRRVPIGRPLANTAVHLLEQGGEPAPLGVPGELCIGGAGVARGYLGRPDLTADRFAPDPFGGEVGGRLYRTGDLARRLPGGDIEFLGRIDHQVKVRGYRIEPGEIEAALDDLPGVVRSAVVTRPRATGESRLIAFLAAAPGEAPPAATLRAGLQERLPDYMVPSAFVTLEALPLTPSGKIDRRALARMPLEAAAGTLGAAGEERDLVAPRNPVEELLAGIWAELLGVPRVGVHDNFFELGGDSILAIRAVARAQKSGVRLSPRDLFQHQTVAELAMVVAAPAEARGDGLPVASAVPGLEVTAADREALGRDLAAETSAAGMSGIKDAYPLTPMQQGILFHSRLAATPAGAAELYVAQFNCTLHGALDPAAFRGAWQRVIDRHAVLRTSFHWAGLDRPLQAVRRHLAAPLDVLDWRHLAAGERAAALAGLLRADRRRGFDTRQAPLLRITLLRLAEAEHQMVFSFHHLLLDGWSMPLLFGELLHLYEALHAGEEPELPPARPFRDYVEWLWRADAATAEETAAFWRRELAGFTAPTPLPLEARPAGAPGLPGAAGPAYTRRFHLLTAEETGALQRLARRGHLTLGTLVQGAWALLLARHAGAGDILFGTTSSGRPAELAGAEEMVGLFIATLPVRVAVDAAAPLFPWLAELQQRLARLRELEHSPLSEIQRWSEVRGALFDSLVIFENYPADLGLGAPPEDGSPRSLQAGGLQALQNTNYPLNLVAALHGDSLFLRLAFDAARHTAPPVERALAQLAALLRAMGAVADDPGAGAGPRLGSIASLGPAELHQLLHEWSDTGRAPAVGPPLHRLFEQRAAAAPAAPALLLDGLAVSYGEIDAHATRLAAALRRLGCAGPETLVAVALRRSPWLPIAMLAVWKAGGAFLPLDPSYPRERLAFMLADSRAGLLLAEPDLCAGDALPRPPGLRAVSVEELWTDGDARPESAAPDPGALAYVIYTSGSTGTPKGVMVEHRGLANLVREQIEAFAITPASRVLQLASSSFDASVSEVWTAWVAGAALVMLPEGSLAADEGLLRRLREHEVSVATFPPSLLAALPQTELPALATLVVAGEASSEALLARWSPGRRRVLNAYGPTEFTVCATIEPYLPELGGEPLLGRPFANTRIRLLGLLDVCDQPAAVGAAGEICLAGVGLARGYLARPDLTAAAFVPDPWSETPGGRMYRTGDLARWTGDGRLAYLGRRDAQVKVRGFRIETGEIEAALARHPDVQACAVVARRDSLVAYVVALPAADPSGPITTLDERLRAFLQSILLEPLVPNRFVTLPALPRTPSGKLDRRALPDPEAVVAGRSAPPQTDLERYVAGLWSEILGVAGIGVDDDFFRLGGHSLSGATVVARLQQDLGEIVHVVVMYDAPTVGALAAYLAEQYPQAVARLLGGAPAPGSPDEPSGAVGTADLEELRDIVARGRGVRSGHAGTGPTNPPALFVLSPPRSGSTLLRVMLAGHPQLFAPPELELLSFETLADRRAAFAGRNSFWLEGAVRALMEIQGCDAEAAEALVAAMEAEGATTGELYRRMQEWIVPRLLIDKTPSYALDPEVLARAERLFGGARYIHLVRHPLAMIRSFEEARLDQVFFRFAHRFSRRQLAELIWTLSEENILAFLAGVAPERCYMLRFEELVERPEEELRRLCGWLEIDFHPAMAAPYEHPESRMTDGIHPWSRMLGDVKFHDHRAVDPAAAHRWREAMKDHVLGGPAAGLAARLGYTPPGQPLYPALVPLKRAHGQPPQPPLVCFHAAGGDAVGYRDLAQEFGGDRPVFAMQARGLVAGETPLTSMDEMAELSLAALLAAVPAGPYYLLGWSFGGLLAYEIACRLAAAGHEVALLAILDTGPHDPTVSGASADRPLYDEAHLLAGAFEAVLPITADEIRAMPEGERLPLLFARAGATGKLPPGLDQAHAQRELATFQANQLIARTYRPGPYPGRVTLIRTPEPAEPPAGRPRRDRTLGWDRLAADVEVHEVPGTHEELIDPPWVEGLADCLRRFLEP
jgi:amino acid adenylation domain-containing protein